MEHLRKKIGKITWKSCSSFEQIYEQITCIGSNKICGSYGTYGYASYGTKYEPVKWLKQWASIRNVKEKKMLGQYFF